MHSTSISLIQRLKDPRRDAAAWERFVQLYSPLLYCWSTKLGLRHDEALDVVQEMLLLLLGKLMEFEHDGRTFRGWLRTILKNKCRDHLRKRARTPQSIDAETMQELSVVDDVAEFTDAEYKAFLSKQALRLIQTDFEETTWRACWLTVVEGLSTREVAATLRISENAVFVARSRVLSRLREEFAGLLNE